VNVDRIRYERPGNAVEPLGVPPGESVDEAGAAESQEFTELLQTLGSSIFAGRFAEQDPLSEEIADFIMPRLAEPDLLQGWRSLAILEELMGAIAPAFEDSEEFRSVAKAVIHTEIVRRRHLQDRLHRGISA
jgi:hypothetical protein